MPLTPGTRFGLYEITGAIGPYQVLSKLGEGGMGEVYRAVDTRLDRVVAIKVSSEAFSERFEREARSVAALNHPNICQLYDVGPDYLVLEYVEGQPVRRVESPRKLVDLAVQMADGLAAAHAAGLVHRDLKPDNILVTADGRAKILDFGIAKAAMGSPDAEALTRSAGITSPGTTLGTVAYMSPEQARGEPNLGPQSDQFSFGLVLYEMVTGQRAFRRDSTAETMAAIIREDPEPLPTSAPAPLRWVIERLLSKDPADRYESTRDLYRELRHIRDRLSQATSVAATEAAASVRPWLPRRRLIRSAGLILAGASAGTALAVALPFGSGRNAGPPDLSRYRFTPISVDAATEREPAWAPDGNRIAYVATVNGVLQVMTRTLGSGQAAQLTHMARHAVHPFWSPDGSTIYFTSRADDEAGMSLWSVNATGGAPEEVIVGATSAAVRPDGRTLAFAKSGRLWIGEASPTGDTPAREFGQTPFEPPAEVQAFSPDGSKLAVVASRSIWVLAYPSGDARRFPLTTREASWMPDSRRLVVPAIDGANITLSMLDTETGEARTFYASAYSLLNAAVSPDGRRIAFMGGDPTWNIVDVHIPSGRVRTMPSAGGVSWWPAWAPSGTHYAFVSDKEETALIRDVNGDGAFSRVIAEVVDDNGSAVVQMRWAPDGHRFTFTVNRQGGGVLMIANASGSPPQPLDDRADASGNGVWSPDGQWLAYHRRVGSEGQFVKARPGSRSEPDVLERWPATSAADAARVPLDWSPDGRWILTVRGRPGVFLVSADGMEERQLSSSRSFSRRPAIGFSRDARSLIYLEQNTGGEGAPWRLWSIDVASGAERVLADVPLPATAGDVAGFSLHPDGTRFLTSVANWPFDIWMLEGFEP